MLSATEERRPAYAYTHNASLELTLQYADLIQAVRVLTMKNWLGF